MKKKLLSTFLALSLLFVVSMFFCIEASAAEIKPTVKLNFTSYEYTGRPMGPGLSVFDEEGNKLVYQEDYLVSYGDGRVYPGTYYVTVSFIGDYEGTEDVVMPFEITESKVDIKLNFDSYEYTGRPMGPGMKITDSKGNLLTYKEDYIVEYGDGRILPGTYTIKIILQGDYYGTFERQFQITESKVDVKLNFTSYEFTGRPMGPGMKVYDSKGNLLTYMKDYTIDYGPGRIEPGTYTLRVYLQGDYYGTVEKQFKITDNKVDVKLNFTSYEFTGRPMGPGMKVYDSKGNLLTYMEDYTIDYGPGRIEPGTYTLRVFLQGNYRGTVEKTFYITENKVDIRLNRLCYEYTGGYLGPGLSVYDSAGRKLTANEDYTVLYGPGRIYPGTYEVYIHLQGNYRGDFTEKFYITPQRVDNSSIKVSGGNKSINVSWKTMTTQSDGYQIQYSLYSDFRDPVWIRIPNVNTSSYTINNLPAGTRYYIRVRTYKKVNGVDHASDWSSGKAVDTKRPQILDIAIGELGNTGGRKYWTWAGYSKREAWCCLFVGWCGDQAGYVDSGVIPVYQAPKDAANWFAKKGQLVRNKNYVPKPGDLIFFDWYQRGWPHHVGIVEKVEGGVVYTVEGNSNDVVKRLSYSIGSYCIYGYATPNY